MEIVNFTLEVIEKAGPTGTLVLFAWLWMSGRIVSRGEFDRMVLQMEKMARQVESERDHERREKIEWKAIAHRGTELAKYFGEKVTTAS